jgi:hypothetical protein
MVVAGDQENVQFHFTKCQTFGVVLIRAIVSAEAHPAGWITPRPPTYASEDFARLSITLTQDCFCFRPERGTRISGCRIFAKRFRFS